MAERSFLYNPASPRGFRLSRYRIESYLSCARCFYLRMRFGIKPPDSYPYTLNIAVDVLLKKEFDEYRRIGQPHPLMTRHGINGYPYNHLALETWRNTFLGMEFEYAPTGYLIVGAPDDLWYVSGAGISVVDYKATASGQDRSIEVSYWAAFKRQIAIYRWILCHILCNDSVSKIGYFVFANGRKDEPRFDGRLNFHMEILSFEIEDEWVAQAIQDIFFSLQRDVIPDANPACGFCKYRRQAHEKECPTKG